MARGLLLTSANAHYLKLKRQGATESAMREALQNRARASVRWAIAGGLASVAVVVGLGFLAKLFGGSR